MAHKSENASNNPSSEKKIAGSKAKKNMAFFHYFLSDMMWLLRAERCIIILIFSVAILHDGGWRVICTFTVCYPYAHSIIWMRFLVLCGEPLWFQILDSPLKSIQCSSIPGKNMTKMKRKAPHTRFPFNQLPLHLRLNYYFFRSAECNTQYNVNLCDVSFDS